MKRKPQAVITLSLTLAALVVTGMLVAQKAQHLALVGELAALPTKPAGNTTGSAAPAAPPGGGQNLLLKPFVGKGGDEARRELVRRLRSGSGSGDLAPLLQSLSAEELLKIIGPVLAGSFVELADGAGEASPSERDEASVRMAALRRLCVLTPEQALAFCAAGVTPGTRASDSLLNVTAGALRHWAGENPPAALRWVKANASWLMPGFPSVVLSQVARTDGLAAAARMARQENVSLAAGMGGFDTSTLGSVNELMTEVDRERAASPEAFAGNAAIRRGYRDMAEKVSNSLGFEAGRKFAETWTVGLPWQEEAAFAAVNSTISPDSASQTAAAADWMIGFVPEDRRSAAAEKLISSWAGIDPGAPLKWLGEHVEAPWRDPAIAAYCAGLVTFDADRAVQWAEAISDESLRASTLTACGK